MTCPGRDDIDVCGTLTAATPTRFSISVPTTVAAGAPFNLTVTAVDANNNTVFVYSGSIHFSSSDLAAVLPADAVLSSGTGTFSVVLKTGGPETITATDKATSSISGTSAPIHLNFGGALGPISVAPGFGSGNNQILTFVFNDPLGWQDLSVVNVLVKSALDARRACYVAYIVSAGTLVLVNDSGDAGGPYVASNSQCAASLVSASGMNASLSLTVNFTFQAAFGETRSCTWPRGTWRRTIPAGGPWGSGRCRR